MSDAARVVRAPEDKRFRRSQVRSAARRRRAHLGRVLTLARWVLGLAVLAATVGAAARWVGASPALHVQRLTVRGNQRLATDEVMRLVGGMRGQHILAVDLEEWRVRLFASPWVADANLRRVLPSTVEITIAERDPMAIGRQRGQLYLIDVQGGVIDDYGPAHADFDLPIVDGLGPSSTPEGAAAAASLLAALGAEPDLMERLSQANVTNPRDVVIILDGDGAQLHLGDRDFVRRIRSYLELAPALRERVPQIDYVDLRFEHRVFVRPLGGSDAQAMQLPVTPPGGE
jgi:cell division protein FtsQ